MTLPENPLTELLRPHVKALQDDARKDDIDAMNTIKWYQMYVRCSGDRAAVVVCEESFKAWLAKQGAPR